MSAKTSFYPELARDIAPAQGSLGVLLPRLGAVSTTLIAGVHLINKGLARPFGSLTQMQKIRLGKRTNPRFVPIKELVPLADPEGTVFGAWDIFPDNAYEAALAAGVLPRETLEKVRPELEAVARWPGVFHRRSVPDPGGQARQERSLEKAPRRNAHARHGGFPLRAPPRPRRRGLVRIDRGLSTGGGGGRISRRFRKGGGGGSPRDPPHYA